MSAPLWLAPGTRVVRAGRAPDGAHARVTGTVRCVVTRRGSAPLLAVVEDAGPVTTLPISAWQPVDFTQLYQGPDAA